MHRILRHALKMVWRHRARTVLTATGSAVAIFVFCCVVAVQEGMRKMQQQSHAQRTLVVFQANRFCPATSHLPQDYADEIRLLPGVREVVPMQVYTNNCRASLDVVVFYGLPPQQLRTARTLQLTAGDWAQFEARQDAALVGRAVAQRRNLAAGDTFSIGELTVFVAGLFTADDRGQENHIYTRLDFLQRTKHRDRVGTVTQIEVGLQPQADLQQTCRAIDDRFRGAAVATDTRPKGVFQAQSLGDLSSLLEMGRYVGYACLGLVLSLVATTTVMSVQDRLREHAVLQVLGFTSRQVFALIVAESMLLSLCGGLLGAGLAAAALRWSRLSVGAEAITIAFEPSWRMLLTGLAASLIAGALAGWLPAWHAARTNIVMALRHP